ncbi:MAG: Lrp/AsnC family transcriptional regulator [Clostridia bacterium]|nr:Lrp/AsnC family transcriptional regulator [Clostridia bacterium]
MKEILEILQSDSTLTPEKIAEKTGLDTTTVKAKIAEFEENGIIAGYQAVINWDKYDTESAPTVFIELKIAPQAGRGFDRIAERICQFPQVKTVYLMSGGYDLFVSVQGESMKEVALFVAEKFATLEGVTSTTTHFILRKYKEDGFMLNNEAPDSRQVITL